MKLEQLEQVIQICQWNSFTTAAQYLFMTQQNLSRSIQALEKELGITIFQRSNKGVTLTADGELLYHFALSTVNAHQKMCSQFSTTQPVNMSLAERPRFAYIGHMQTFIPPLLHNLKNNGYIIAPDCQLMSREECIAMLEFSRDYDLVFYQDDTKSLSKTNFSEHYHQYNLFIENLVLFSNKSNPIAQYQTIPLSVLCQLPIHRYSGQNGAPNLSYILKNHNVEINTLSNLSHFSLVKTMLSMDQGFFIGLPSMYEAFEIATKTNISAIPIDLPIKVASSVFIKKSFAASPLGQHIISIFTRAYNETILQVY